MKTQCNSTRVQAPALKSMPTESTLIPVNTYDGLVLKPLGRSKPETDRVGQDRFTSRKLPFNISTFNTQTLRSPTKREELAHEAALYNIDIICLQEHRNVHSEALLQETFNEYTLITSSAWKNQQNASTGGVGFLISPRALKSVQSITCYNKRIIQISLHGNPVTTILCCYSPHNVYPEEVVTEFYQDLTTIINGIPAHNLLIIGGDFNAQLGPSDALFTLAKETNRNGKHMKDFMEQHNLVATNTRFQNRKGRLWTHRRPNGTCIQLDYILVRKKWVNSIKNSRAYSSFEGVNSDHRIVSCTCQISYRKSKPLIKDPMKRIDWKAVARDNILSEQFTVAVHNRFSSLRDKLDQNNISTVYNTLITANEEIALEMLPKKTQRICNNASTEEVNAARENMKMASIRHKARPTRATKRCLDTTKEALDDAYNGVLETHIKNKTQELENLHHQHKHAAAWEIMREVTNTRTSPVIRIKGDTADDRRNSMFEHFSSLLGKPDQNNTNLDDPFFNLRISDTLPISTGPFYMEELQKGINKLQKSKTPGPDNIPAIIWKSPLFHQQLIEFCNETKKGNKPDALAKSSIIPLPKKGDLSLPSNYRGITLSALASKLYNTMLLNRIAPPP